MTIEQQQIVLISEIGFDYFTNCIENGAIPEEAKAEMMTPAAQYIIAKRIQNIINQ